MPDKWPFTWFYLKPDGNKVTTEEWEQFLLNKLKAEPQNPEVLWYLVLLYRKLGRTDEARTYLDQIRSQFDDSEKEAALWVGLGGRLEKQRDYEGAVETYRQAVSLEPTDPFVAYFAHNNLGYSLVQLRQYEDAEYYCRKAIKIDDKRYNAHKNLGLSLEGQGMFTEAAHCYICTVLANPRDPRAFRYLEQLMENHPEVSYEIPDILDTVAKCREAVRKAQERRRRKDTRDNA
jgi:tetratricopeptide (TPR) repeat protein